MDVSLENTGVDKSGPSTPVGNNFFRGEGEHGVVPHPQELVEPFLELDVIRGSLCRWRGTARRRGLSHAESVVVVFFAATRSTRVTDTEKEMFDHWPC